MTIAREEDRSLVHRLLERTDKACLVARSLAFPVVVEPAIKIEEELVVQERVRV